ncbi:endonuclease III [Pedobacter metabolipauper]|uniref:Endonuclease III n=1 Tax=Pedobacter metabolipauper TaxID=425513 RepID=A0A4R6SUY9_9SPHI|nr:endonuclease III [Pedobacter metabolipauper]TDQ08856.1 DNA-(apurinic or apyrimidinic site) lyase /endonuclease III [Pedobacter metabolipauper]
MLKKDRYKLFVSHFSAKQPNAETELHYNNPFQLLVAVILSAQCTDKRINQVTPALFQRFPNAKALADVTPDIVFDYIRSVSYPNNKAKHLVGMATMLLHEFNNEVPSDIDQLQKMPGVGRKTANVIASVIYNAPAMAVDTHVFRVSNRIGLSSGKTPLAVEKELVKNLPEHTIHVAHHWLILHGRYVCVARSPKCSICEITNICKYYQKNNKITNLFSDPAL